VEVVVAGERYDWIDAWGRVDSAPEVQPAWPHHGIVAAGADLIVSFHPSQSWLLYFDSSGAVRRAVPIELAEAHGITVSRHRGQTRLWIADAAMKKDPATGYTSPIGDAGSAVVEVDLDGRVLRKLPRPPDALYREGRYRPTCAVAFDDHLGGNGDIWVADGYGGDLVHRFSAAGEYVATLDGIQGAGRFSVPHALFIDTRHGEPELYVADRANGRIQVFDMEGRYRHAVGEPFLSRPTWMTAHRDLLFVAEFLPPRLCVLDAEDRLVCVVGEDRAAPDREEWPNQLTGGGELARPTALTAGRFNSPHAVTVDEIGNLYITEWLIGGRTIKLQRM
jgi:hypothetical protein